MYLYNEFLYRPLFNALIFLYDAIPIHDFGIAIILLTIAIRLILWPLFHKSAEHQAIMQRLQPKVNELKEKHKNDREAHTRATLALYREHRVNPLTGFLLLLVQLPILIALYQVFQHGLSPSGLDSLYSFISRPAEFQYLFLGLVDVTKPSITLAILVGLSQYFLGRMTLPPAASSKDPAAIMSRQMVYLGPILATFIFIYLKLSVAVGIYWLTTTLFSIGQQVIINRSIKNSELS